MEQNQPAARVVRGRNRIRTSAVGDAEPDTVRAHIQRIALELFIEEGYDKTSLREIAEKLGVTKAALYYHFPTKDDIVSSLIEHRVAAVDRLMEWAEAQPRTEQTRIEFVRRYSVLHDLDKHENVIRFFERNQTLINTMAAGKLMRGQMERVFDFLMDPEESTVQQLQRAMAIFTIHAGWFVFRGRDLTSQQRRDATLEVAEDMMRMAAARGVPTCDGVPTGDRVPAGGAVPAGDRVPTGGAVPAGDRVPTGGAVPAGDRVPTGDAVPAGGQDG